VAKKVSYFVVLTFIVRITFEYKNIKIIKIIKIVFYNLYGFLFLTVQYGGGIDGEQNSALSRSNEEEEEEEAVEEETEGEIAELPRSENISSETEKGEEDAEEEEHEYWQQQHQQQQQQQQ